jgi:cytosine/adenosine deaminase-related metal-dependent hydrolase
MAVSTATVLPLHFHIRDGRISGLNGEAGLLMGRMHRPGGLAVLPGLVDGHIHLDKSFVGDQWHPPACEQPA